jgi:hypothetical protein
VLAEDVGYLIDDERRWEALERPRRTVGPRPERIIAASDADLRAVVSACVPTRGSAARAGAPNSP